MYRVESLSNPKNKQRSKPRRRTINARTLLRAASSRRRRLFAGRARFFRPEASVSWVETKRGATSFVRKASRNQY